VIVAIISIADGTMITYMMGRSMPGIVPINRAQMRCSKDRPVFMKIDELFSHNASSI
jgi:hypothetical protein